MQRAETGGSCTSDAYKDITATNFINSILKVDQNKHKIDEKGIYQYKGRLFQWKKQRMARLQWLCLLFAKYLRLATLAILGHTSFPQ
uniref:Uncharacterized protein n=1 Tax=Oryza punctata TaxID=4537 RepID=A0A0E0MI07_ORYPU